MNFPKRRHSYLRPVDLLLRPGTLELAERRIDEPRGEGSTLRSLHGQDKAAIHAPSGGRYQSSEVLTAGRKSAELSERVLLQRRVALGEDLDLQRGEAIHEFGDKRPKVEGSK